MKLIVNDCEYPCATAAKTENEVRITDAEGRETVFSGIRDMSSYVLEGGDWGEPAPSRLDALEAQAAYTALMTDTLI